MALYAGLLLLACCGLKSSNEERECNGKNVTNGKQNINGHNCLTGIEYKSFELKFTIVTKEENGISKQHLPQRPQLPSTENIVILSLSLLIVPFIPAANLFFYVGFVIAERVLYIPSMGFCLLVTVGTRILYVKTPKRCLKNLIFLAIAALIFFYGLKTFIRNEDWQNEEMLYKSGIKVNPAKGKIHSRFPTVNTSILFLILTFLFWKEKFPKCASYERQIYLKGIQIHSHYKTRAIF